VPDFKISSETLNSSPEGQNPADAANEPLIDLDHLQRQTFGDSALIDEILNLYIQETGATLAAIHEFSLADRQSLLALAHRQIGSALAVGATGVARAARALEALLGRSTCEPADFDRVIEALAANLVKTRALAANLRK